MLTIRSLLNVVSGINVGGGRIFKITKHGDWNNYRARHLVCFVYILFQECAALNSVFVKHWTAKKQREYESQKGEVTFF